VGGGPTGLLLSTLLSTYSIPSTLLEARPSSAISGSRCGHPQAHYINLRSMEILRHHLPDLYGEVTEAMPPVEEWEGFNFCHSVLGRSIGRVVHPVQGLGVAMEGNGILIREGDRSANRTTPEITADSYRERRRRRVSPCDPGHLAQNKFAALLLEAAQNAARSVPGAEILHEVAVEHVLDHHGGPSSSNLEVRTKCGRTFNPLLVVAADGASSSIRQSHGVRMLGQPMLQHLISVHFRTTPSLSAKLAADADKANMLHFVFNEKLVGCFVCHDLQEGEWVLQVPYFEPFQTSEAYTTQRVRELIMAGLGIDAINDGDGARAVDALSIRPWTMSSTVAETYLAGPSQRIVLAGDAAHAFPPAGGFGMNTGLQDAHNLAWRLALSLDGGHADSALTKSLEQYQLDRRPIASQNAALSVRNYNRTLEVAKACYLNADHPAILVKAMSVPPLSFVPMNVRENMFDAAVKAATLPLRGLGRVGNPYGERIKRNVREKLGQGQGLPLLFPRYEVGFGYGEERGLGEGDDTAGFSPTIEVGRRLPHVELAVVVPSCSEDCAFPSTLSLTDVGAQLRSLLKDQISVPAFTVIIAGSFASMQPQLRDVLQATASASSESGIAIDIVIIESGNDAAVGASISTEYSFDRNALLLLDSGTKLSSKLQFEGIMLVRPDGHVAKLLPFDETNEEIETNRYKDDILFGISEVV